MKSRALLATALVALGCLLGLSPLVASVRAAALPYGDRGWFWGNPLPQGNDLEAIDMFGTRGFAGVGGELETDDAGTTWRRSELGGRDGGRRRVLQSVEFVDADTLVGTADCGKLLRSDDGGSSFTELRYTASTGPGCGHAVTEFPTSEVGYVLWGTAVYRTPDGGRTFEVRAPVNARKLVFISPDVGFAVADDAIHRTSDGARSWSQVASSGAALTDVDFPDAQHGYAVGFGGTLLRTDDGGITWWRPPAVGMPDLDLRSVRCADTGTCLMAGETPQDDIFPERGVWDSGILRTGDGGGSVQRVSSERVLALDHASPTRVVAVGRRGLILTSDDGGASFNEVSHGSQDSYSMLSSASARVVYALGGRTGLGRSENGGRSWSPVGLARPPGTRLTWVDFLDERTGLLIAHDTTGPRTGRRAHLLRTDDAASSWHVVGAQASQDMRSAVALPRRRVVALGRAGLLVSRDSGRSFRAVRDPALRRLRLRALDTAPGAVVAVGDHGLALSRDRGQSWRRIESPRGEGLIATDFVTPLLGFVATFYGRRVYVTRDGGQSWRRVRGVGSFDTFRVSFGDRRHGFLVGSGPVRNESVAYSGGALLRTSDGGRTWRPQPIWTEHALALGSSGGVLSHEGALAWTSTGGETGARSRLAISARVETGKRRRIVVTGRLSPAEAGDRVVVSHMRSGYDKYHVPFVGSDGHFRTTFEATLHSFVVAHWAGGSGRRPAATRAIPIPKRW